MERPPPSAHPASVPRAADVVVIGGGIIGCSAAAMLADRGATVVLIESTAIGAGASGRNLGAVQHPFDAVLAPLYHDSVTRYRALAGESPTFRIGERPAGLLLLNRDHAAATAQARRMAREFPGLGAELLSPAEVIAEEPFLAPGPAAVRLETGYPIPPGSATAAWADLAVERGARLVIGVAAHPEVARDRARGVTLDDGRSVAAGAVLVAAGPRSAELVDPAGEWRPIRSTWGVTVQVRLGAAAPRHVVEEDEVGSVNRAQAATARAARAELTVGHDTMEAEPPSLFSIASAGGLSTIGSTFLPEEPDPTPLEALLLRRAAAFLPAVGDADVVERRICARPQSVDGHPFIGRVAGVRGLFVCAGHGPWGISTGPASAALVARAILDGTPPPSELDAARRVSAA